MQISLIYVLITAEILLILLGLCITLIVMLVRRPKADVSAEEATDESAADELDAIELGNSYIDFLDIALERNVNKRSQQENIEQEEDASEEAEDATEDDGEDSETSETEVDTESTDEHVEEESESSPPPGALQSELLQAREEFLQMEKTAAEKSEHEIYFWESIYEGMQGIYDKLKTFEVINNIQTQNSTTVDTQTESTEKVFYIEKQGKKIDGEVNKLKDIIFEQENALSSMKKALGSAEEEMPDGSESLQVLKDQIAEIERQLSDSKMCMEVLEMENDRLQEEIDKIEHEGPSDEDGDSESTIDIDQMKEVVVEQENKIQQLMDTIEGLELEAGQAEKLKKTLQDFTRTSQEMMSCISILEEENERLQQGSGEQEGEASEAAPADSGASVDTEEMKSKISSLEQEIIKKDVAYAQLQDEFSSMETEYLSMYEAMHGDGDQ